MRRSQLHKKGTREKKKDAKRRKRRKYDKGIKGRN